MIKTYQVILSTSKTITVNAIDYEDAMEKAERKANRTSNKWMAETAIEVDESCF